jgi:hypothetical protein
VFRFLKEEILGKSEADATPNHQRSLSALSFPIPRTIDPNIYRMTTDASILQVRRLK